MLTSGNYEPVFRMPAIRQEDAHLFMTLTDEESGKLIKAVFSFAWLERRVKLPSEKLNTLLKVITEHIRLDEGGEDAEDEEDDI